MGPDPLPDSLPESRSVWSIQDFDQDLISDRGRDRKDMKEKQSKELVELYGNEDSKDSYVKRKPN